MKKLKPDLGLITRHLLNETDNTEKEMIKNIINNDDKSRQEFEKYLDLWEKSEDVREFDKIDAEKDWNSVRAKMNFTLSKKEISPRIYLIRIAAILILALGLGSVFYLVVRKNNPVSEYFETASVNQTKEVILPEGTRISLNRNSKIVRNSEFGKTNRDIILVGEAFFEVAKNPNLPFKVYTKNSTVEVTGTSFNIKSDSIQVTVGVLTGKVSFYQTGNSVNRIDLVPQKTGYFHTVDNSFKLETSLDPNSVAWHTGRLVFYKTPLKEAFKIIAAYFNKELVIEPDAPVNQPPVKAEFEKQSLEDMVNTINLTLYDKFEVISTDTRIIVKKR
jgi:transmembrane sensor